MEVGTAWRRAAASARGETSRLTSSSERRTIRVWPSTSAVIGAEAARSPMDGAAVSPGAAAPAGARSISASAPRAMKKLRRPMQRRGVHQDEGRHADDADGGDHAGAALDGARDALGDQQRDRHRRCELRVAHALEVPDGISDDRACAEQGCSHGEHRVAIGVVVADAGYLVCVGGSHRQGQQREHERRAAHTSLWCHGRP
jgi:hypothetical protein